MSRISVKEGLPAATEALLADMMPSGVPPLNLFRTIAHNPRVLEKLRASNLLDRGDLSLREREIIIDRMTALSNAEYEWGVHIAFFAEKVKFSAEHIRSLTVGNADDPCWNASESLLLQMCDELHETSTLTDGTLAALQSVWDEARIIEAVAIAGYYKMISFLVNVCAPDKESYGVEFSSVRIH